VACQVARARSLNLGELRRLALIVVKYLRKMDGCTLLVGPEITSLNRLSMRRVVQRSVIHSHFVGFKAEYCSGAAVVGAAVETQAEKTGIPTRSR